jgi:hypothetical protein
MSNREGKGPSQASFDRVVMGAPQVASLRESLAQKYQPPVATTRSLAHTRQVPAASGFAEAADLDAVPVLPQYRKAYAQYLTKARPSAFAIKENGAYRYIVGNADAMERLLGDCERAGEVCWLYAVDDTVVWQRDIGKRISSIRQLKPAVVSAAAP